MPRRYFIVNLRLDELRLIESALTRSQDVLGSDEREEKLKSKIRSIRERIESRQQKEYYQAMKARENYNV